MPRKLIRATELAEFVYCSRTWELKYMRGVQPSREAQQLQIEGNAWHAAQGRALARTDSLRWAAYAALAFAAILFTFCWLGWAR
jgi:hypothetical protein